jgi:NACHT domain- and WD repeat-containing protein
MRGARFQAIDLRWGVSEEAALDQRSMGICLDEIARCRRISPKPNFIVLLGERYGWCPLPSFIPAEEFETILNGVPQSQRSLLTTDEPVPAWRNDVSLVRLGWYRKDLNAVPAQYVLQPRTIDFPPDASDNDRRRTIQQEAEDWRGCEAAIHALLSSAMDELGWAEHDPRRQRYERSATHQEIEAGALQVGLDAEEHVFAYSREITGVTENEATAAFIDADKARNNLAGLKLLLEQRLPDSHFYRYKARWEGDHPEADFDALCHQVYEDLRGVIEAELRNFQQRSELEREKEAHREFGEERSRVFVGRADLLDRINSYLEDPHDDRPLVIYGPSGCGKTALMARAWLMLREPEQAVARFIGATPASTDLRTLLHSICEQLGILSPSTDINDLVRTFRERLAGVETASLGTSRSGRDIVILDALDQLNPNDDAGTLHWLPQALAPGVKLVLSVAQLGTRQEREVNSDDAFEIARRIWPNRLLEVGNLTINDGQTLLHAWLDSVGRTLQDEQRQDILEKFAHHGRPLFLKVAFEVAKHWPSWESLPNVVDAISGLSGSTQEVVAGMLRRLEEPRHHGNLLVEHALGSIATAKHGLTEDELLDIISAQKVVMDDHHRRHPESPQVDRLPIVAWSRLRADLNPYLAERRADGTVAISFYHRQIADVVKDRYLANAEKQMRAHVRLGDYFHKLDFWAESLEAQRERASQLPPSPRPANIRKVVELPYHRLEAAKLGGQDDPCSPHWNAVADLLTDWRFLEAKAEADQNSYEPRAIEPSSAEDGGAL